MIAKTLLLVFLIAVSSPAFAVYGDARAEVVSVYDGDTFRVNVIGWPPIIGFNMPIRVRGIDAPEIRARCEAERPAAIAARDFARSLLMDAEVVELKSIDRGKYFRIIADVVIDGRDFAEIMLSAGHAVRYDGGSRASAWCD